MCPPTAPSNGCSTSAAATPSRRSTSRKTTAARCASRRRPAARSAAASVPPVTRASAATSARARSSPSSGMPNIGCASRAGERVIDNVVMMGMGEPLQNYAALLPALRTMLDDHGYGLSRRRVTVSTSGVVPMIDRLREDCPVALAVSLHAPDDALRESLVPLNRKYPIAELLDACVALPGAGAARLHHLRVLHARRRERLARASRGAGAAACEGRVSCKFNLIPFNPFPASGLLRSPRERVLAFAQVLQDAGIVTTIRKTRGDDIAAACGQLAGEVQDRTRARERLVRRRAAIPIVMSRAGGTALMRLLVLTLALAAALAGCVNVPLRNARRRRRRCRRRGAQHAHAEGRRPHRAAAHGTGRRLLQPRPDRRPRSTRSSQALAARPDLPEAYNLRGLIYASLGRTADGRGQLPARAAAQARATPTPMHNFGWFLCQERRYREADVQFDAALAQPQYRERRARCSRRACARRATAAGRGRAQAAAAPTSSTPATRPPRYNLTDVLYRRGEYDRARFYIARVNAVREQSNAQTLWLAIAHRAQARQHGGRAGSGSPAARTLPAVAPRPCSTSGATSMSESHRHRPRQRRLAAARRAREAGPAHRGAGRGDQGHAAQARRARARPLRRAARRDLHARAGADGLSLAEDRPAAGAGLAAAGRKRGGWMRSPAA